MLAKHFSIILAQAANGDAAPAGAQGLSLLIPIVAAVVLYFVMILRPERKKQAEQKAKLDGLKKNDRVVTIGGLYGVVMDVQREADKVTLKVDEQNNTKIRVTFGAIARILGDDPAGE